MQPSPLTGIMETSAQLGFAPHAGEQGGSLKKADTVMLVSAITIPSIFLKAGVFFLCPSQVNFTL